MVQRCLARGRHRILLEPKRGEGLLHQGQPKTVLSPHFLLTLAPEAHHRFKMLRWPRKSRYHLTCRRRRAQRPIDHTGCPCRFHNIQEAQSD